MKGAAILPPQRISEYIASHMIRLAHGGSTKSCDENERRRTGETGVFVYFRGQRRALRTHLVNPRLQTPGWPDIIQHRPVFTERQTVIQCQQDSGQVMRASGFFYRMEDYDRQRLICPFTSNPGFVSAHEGQPGNQHGTIHRDASLKQGTLDGTATYGKELEEKHATSYIPANDANRVLARKAKGRATIATSR